MQDRVVTLLARLRSGRISRRDFIRCAALLGVSVGTAEALAACAIPAATPAPPTPTYAAPTQPYRAPTPTMQYLNPLYEPSGESQGGFVPGAVPPETLRPTATLLPAAPATPYPTMPRPTATPVMWEPAVWWCKECSQRFASEVEFVRHYLAEHAVKAPGARQVDKPTYAQFLTQRAGRFDQRNDVFSRGVWDRDYQAEVFQVVPRSRRESAAEMLEGRARVAGSIYVDLTAGSLHPGYGGYFGHLQGVAGLYSWDDPVVAEQFPVSDPAEATALIKSMARFYGADLVGVCEINPMWVYSNYFDRATGGYGPLEIPYRYAVVMGIEMDFAGIRQSPGFPASAATARAYSNMAEISSKLARYIRGLGYPAVPSGNDTTQSIPLAIDAGLGELGRLGLLLTPEFGARQRICKVYTSLPLVPDRPIDFGMQRFCETCQACAHACPVQAIPRGERSYELTSISNRPGILRWHVNVGKCFQFWVANGGSLDGLSDCANCVGACPWSQQSRPWL